MADHSKEKPLIVAKIGAPHGVRGDLKLHTFTENPDSILSYKSLLLEQKRNCFEPLENAKIYTKGQYLLIRFDEFQDRDIAKRFTNKHLAVWREDLPEPEEDEVYWSDLEGLKVINTQGVELGVVDHLFDTGSNDVMVLKGKTPHLIPYIDQTVLEVDLTAGLIRVDWDEDF